jgi:5-methylcytosine-specific restriction endonuclease McrBC regulatory subunit McrC
MQVIGKGRTVQIAVLVYGVIFRILGKRLFTKFLLAHHTGVVLGTVAPEPIGLSSGNQSLFQFGIFALVRIVIEFVIVYGKAGNQICGYVINMERAFENIVCYYTNAVALKLGLSHKDQASIRFATANGNYDYDYDIRPDDLVSGDGKYLVMDAKYKVLSVDNRYKRKPSRDDFYQMVSSCIAYKSPEAILVYPLTAKFPNQTWSTIQTVNGEKINIKSIGIDILGSNDDISNTIKAALQDSYLYKEKNI